MVIKIAKSYKIRFQLQAKINKKVLKSYSFILNYYTSLYLFHWELANSTQFLKKCNG